MKQICLVAMLLLTFCISSQVYAQEKNATGFYYPTGSSNFGDYLGWLGYNSAQYPWHLAQDMKAAYNTPVYAIDNGTVVLSRSNVGGYGGLDSSGNPLPGGAFVVRHTTRSGRIFYMLYGHIKPDTLPAVGATVTAGTVIAYVGHYWYPNGSDVSHVHSGCMPDALPSNPWAGYCTVKHGDHLGFVNPWHNVTLDGYFDQGFLDNNQPSYNQGSDTDIWVDGSRGSTGNGNQGNPFNTVLAAVNAANASQPVTIHITPGVYSEKISTSKHIHFVTNGSGTVRIGG